MKVLEFETSKGKFILVDNNDFPKSLEKYTFIREGITLMFGINLSKITEEQAIEIVDEFKRGYKNYSYKGNKLGGQQVSMVIRDCFNKSTDSLYSLFDSKGIHLFENPVPEPEYQFDNFGNGGMCEHWINTYQEQEQKTFYNPYIFKI